MSNTNKKKVGKTVLQPGSIDFDKLVSEWEGDAIYFNGFTCGVGIGDISIVLQRNNESVAVLNTSYTVAKTLVEKLNGLIKNLENRANTTILTTDQIVEAMSKNDASKSKH